MNDHECEDVCPDVTELRISSHAHIENHIFPMLRIGSHIIEHFLSECGKGRNKRDRLSLCQCYRGVRVVANIGYRKHVLYR